MPTRATPMWMLTVLLLIGAPLLNILYWFQVLAADALPPDGDAVMPLMFAGVLFTLLVSPFVLGVTWFCLRRYNPQTKLLAWRRDRIVRSVLASLVFGTPAAILAVAVVEALLGAYPWYEHILTTLLPLAIAWLLAMRAAVIEQSGPIMRQVPPAEMSVRQARS